MHEFRRRERPPNDKVHGVITRARRPRFFHPTLPFPQNVLSLFKNYLFNQRRFENIALSRAAAKRIRTFNQGNVSHEPLDIFLRRLWSTLNLRRHQIPDFLRVFQRRVRAHEHVFLFIRLYARIAQRRLSVNLAHR